MKSRTGPIHWSLLLVAGLVLAPSVAAQTIELGLGYDRARDGNGFDLHRAGDTYILYFYTYDSAGEPEWFVGTSELNGSALSGDLLRFTYQSGEAVQDTQFNGSFTLDYGDPQSAPACNDGVNRSGAQQLAAFNWQTGNDSGAWCTELLAFGSANANAPYYGGVWYGGPSDSGYGFTLANMDQTSVVVFYYYDADGQPRWALGSGPSGTQTIDLVHYNGYCRTCTPTPTVGVTAGTLALTWNIVTAPGEGFDSASARVSYPNSPFGDFDRDFTLFRLSDGTNFGSLDEVFAFFESFVSSSIIQSRCVLCHTPGGVSGATRLTFQRSDVPNYQALNLDAIRNFLDTVPDGDSLILSKVRGESHGGGAQLPQGSDGYNDLSELLGLLLLDDSTEPQVDEVKAFFAGTTKIDNEATLRKAALLFAGRLPTVSESSAVANGDDVTLKSTVREMMNGEAFHQFLLRGANDQLLTDKFLREIIVDEFSIYFADFVNYLFELRRDDENAFFQVLFETVYAIARAPLELIAYVVENERPYTEVLTGDYIMVNPTSNLVYGSGLTFTDPNDRDEWRPGQILGYQRIGQNFQYECTNSGCQVFSGGLATDFPHAGVLNTLAFLSRYPSTATNRNRARARWTYYFFLDVDIEKLASRPLDSETLSDTNNPTLNNPACTACHVVHDPVAGAYQNYGDQGFYKNSFGGQDSLSEFYKFPEDGSATEYVPGDVWYRDMRAPGFKGQIAPDSDNSIQWLGQEIANDSRFPAATVKFWWPAVFGDEPVESPENPADDSFAAQQKAYDVQQTFVRQLAEDFRSNANGNGAFNLKDLLVEMVVSDWFRANGVSGVTDEHRSALEFAKVGVEQLLTPEQLNAKLIATTGYEWGIPAIFSQDELIFLRQLYDLYYGGIDSNGITQRARQMTPLMSKVVSTLSHEASCPIVVEEFSKAAGQRVLLGSVSRLDTPVTEIVRTFSPSADFQDFSVSGTLDAGSPVARLSFLDNALNDSDSRTILIDRVTLSDDQGQTIATYEGNEFETQSNVSANCGRSVGTDWEVPPTCIIDIQIDLAESSSVTMDVRASTPSSAILVLGLNQDALADTSAGGTRIKRALQQFHSRLLGEKLTLNDPDLLRSYQLFTDIWSGRVDANRQPFVVNACGFQSVLTPPPASDPFQSVNTWIAMLTYFLSDYRFIHE